MFESFVANLLSNRASQFVKNIPHEQLRVGVWQGEVVLDDLELRSDSLDGLGLPISIEAGYVGSLRVSIPWKYLGTKVVVAELKQIHIILKIEEKSLLPVNAETYSEISKQASIAAAEIAKRSKSSGAFRSFTSRLMSRLLSCFELRIYDIHVRIEADSSVSGGPPIAFGFMCDEILTKASGSSQQLLEVKGASLYWDRDVSPTQCSHLSLPELSSLFELWKGGDKPSVPSVHEDDEGDIFYVAPSEDEILIHHFLLQPCDITVKGSYLYNSKIEILVEMPQVNTCIEVGQLWDIFRIVDWFQIFDLRRRNASFRPIQHGFMNPKMLWHFAIESTLAQIRRSRWRLSWFQLQGYLNDRREYTELYRLILMNRATNENKRKLAQIESRLPVDGIMFARGVAEKLAGRDQSSQTGWYKWGLLRWAARSSDLKAANSNGSSDKEDATAGLEDMGLDVSLTKEQEDFLLKLGQAESSSDNSLPRIESDSSFTSLLEGRDSDQTRKKDALASLANADANRLNRSLKGGQEIMGLKTEEAQHLANIWFGKQESSTSQSQLQPKVDVKIKEISVTLAVLIAPDEDEHGEEVEDEDSPQIVGIQEIMTVYVHDTSLSMRMLEREFRISCSVKSVKARDMLTSHSCYPWLIVSKPPKMKCSPGNWYMPTDHEEEDEEDSSSNALEVEVTVITARQDSRQPSAIIDMLLNPLEVSLSPDCLQALALFFVPEFEYPFHEHLVLDALNSIGDGPGLLAAKLQYMIDHMGGGFLLNLRAKSLKLLLPLDVSLHSRSLFVVDVAEIVFSSSPYGCLGYTHNGIMRLVSKALQSTDPEEQKQTMQQMFFLPMKVSLDCVQVTLAKAELESPANLTTSNPLPQQLGSPIVQPFSMQLDLQVSLLRADASIPLVFLLVELPTIRSEMERSQAIELVEDFCAVENHRKLGENQVKKILRVKMQRQALRAQTGLSPGGSLSASCNISREISKDWLESASSNFERDSEVLPGEEEEDMEGSSTILPEEKMDGDRSREHEDLSNAELHLFGDQREDEGEGEGEGEKLASDEGGEKGINEIEQEQKMEANGKESREEEREKLEKEKAGEEKEKGGEEDGDPQKGEALDNHEAEAVQAEARRSFWSRLTPLNVFQQRKSAKVDSQLSKENTASDRGKQEVENIPLIEEDANYSSTETCPVQQGPSSSWWPSWLTRRKKDSKTVQFDTGAAQQHEGKEEKTSAPPPHEAVAVTSGIRPREILSRLSTNFFKPLAGSSVDKEEEVAANKVLNLPVNVRAMAASHLRRHGKEWSEQPWRERLQACALFYLPGKQYCESLSTNKSSSLPRLRERHGSSFLILDRTSMEAVDNETVHAEVEVKMDKVCFMLRDAHLAEDELQVSLHVSGLDRQPSAPFSPPSSPPTAHNRISPRDRAITLSLRARRHGVDLKTTIGSVNVRMGEREKIRSNEVETYLLSTHGDMIIKMCQSTSNGEPGMQKQPATPFLELECHSYSDEYAPKGKSPLSLICKMDGLALCYRHELFVNLYKHLQHLVDLVPSATSSDSLQLLDGTERTPSLQTSRSGGEEVALLEAIQVDVSFNYVHLACSTAETRNWLTCYNSSLYWNKLDKSGKCGSADIVYLGLHHWSSASGLVQIFGPGKQEEVCMLRASVEQSFPPLSDPSFRPESPSQEHWSWRLQHIVLALKHLKHLQQDHTLHFRAHKCCFTGEELLTALVTQRQAQGREQALLLANLLVREGYINNILDEREFEPPSLFRFASDRAASDQMAGGGVGGRGPGGGDERRGIFVARVQVGDLSSELSWTFAEDIIRASKLASKVPSRFKSAQKIKSHETLLLSREDAMSACKLLNSLEFDGHIGRFQLSLPTAPAQPQQDGKGGELVLTVSSVSFSKTSFLSELSAVAGHEIEGETRLDTRSLPLPVSTKQNIQSKISSFSKYINAHEGKTSSSGGRDSMLTAAQHVTCMNRKMSFAITGISIKNEVSPDSCHPILQDFDVSVGLNAQCKVKEGSDQSPGVLYDGSVKLSTLSVKCDEELFVLLDSIADRVNALIPDRTEVQGIPSSVPQLPERNVEFISDVFDCLLGDYQLDVLLNGIDLQLSVNVLSSLRFVMSRMTFSSRIATKFASQTSRSDGKSLEGLSCMMSAFFADFLQSASAELLLQGSSLYVDDVAIFDVSQDLRRVKTESFEITGESVENKLGVVLRCANAPKRSCELAIYGGILNVMYDEKSLITLNDYKKFFQDFNGKLVKIASPLEPQNLAVPSQHDSERQDEQGKLQVDLQAVKEKLLQCDLELSLKSSTVIVIIRGQSYDGAQDLKVAVSSSLSSSFKHKEELIVTCARLRDVSVGWTRSREEDLSLPYTFFDLPDLDILLRVLLPSFTADLEAQVPSPMVVRASMVDALLLLGILQQMNQTLVKIVGGETTDAARELTTMVKQKAEGEHKVPEEAIMMTRAVRSFSFRAESIRVMTADCRRGGSMGFLRLPLIELKLDSLVVAGVDVNSDHPCAKFACSASSSYFNRSISCWEPFLERMSFALSATLDLTLESVIQGGAGGIKVDFISSDVTNINLSSAFVDVVSGIVKHASSLQKQDVLRERQEFHPLWVQNEIGMPIVLQCKGVRQVVDGKERQPVSCVPLVQTSGLMDGLPVLGMNQMEIFLLPDLTEKSIEQHDLNPQVVHLDVIGKQVVTVVVPILQELGIVTFQNVKILIDISVQDEGASKLILIRSPLSIKNHLSAPFEIMFAEQTSVQGPTIAGRTRYTIPAGESMVVPVLYIDNKDGFSLRPLPSSSSSSSSAITSNKMQHPGYRWVTGESLLASEWSTRHELKTFKGLGLHGLPLNVLLHWDCDSLRRSCHLSILPCLSIENLLPVPLFCRITTTTTAEPPSPREFSGSLWAVEIEAGESLPVLDRDLSRGNFLWLSVKVDELGWSSHLLLRESGDSDELSVLDGWSTQAWVLSQKRKQRLSSTGEQGRALDLEADIMLDAAGTCCVLVYSAYWIVNRTNSRAQITQDDAEELMRPPVILDGFPLQHVEDPSLLQLRSGKREEEAGTQDLLLPIPNLVMKSGERGEGEGRQSSKLSSAIPQGLAWLAEMEREESAEWMVPGRVDGGALPNLQLFSCSEMNAGGRVGLRMRLDCTDWSDPFTMTGSSTMDTGKVELRLKRSGFARQSRRMEVGVAIQPVRGKFHRSKCITITPRYVIVNETNFPLQARQEGTASSLTIPCGPSHNCVVWHWTDPRKRHNVRLALEPEKSSRASWHDRWSGAFSIDEVGDTVIMMESEESPGPVYADVRVRRFLGSMAIIVKPSQTNQPPYWIENFSASTLRVYQEGVGRRLVYIRPYQGVPYTWESAMSSKQLLVVEVEGSSPLLSGRFELDSIGEHKPMLNSRGDVLYRVFVRCHGPTLTLSVTDALLHPSDSQVSLKTDMQYLSAAHKTIPSALQTAALPSRWQFEMSLEMMGVGISLIDSRSPREILYVWLGCNPRFAFSGEVEDVASEHKKGLSLSVWRTLFEEGIRISLKCVQVDNLEQSASYPVVVRFTGRDQEEELEERTRDSQGSMRITISRNSFLGGTVKVFRRLEMFCRELDVAFDEGLVLDLLHLCDDVGASLSSASRQIKELLSTKDQQDEELVRNLLQGNSDLSEAIKGSSISSLFSSKIYVHDLRIYPLMLNISYTPAVTTFDFTSLRSLQHLLASSRFFFHKVEDVPFYLGELRMSHSFGAGSTIANRIRDHYLQQILLVISRVVGSTNVLGNPLGLVNALSSGVVDLFKQPAKELQSGRSKRAGGGSYLHVGIDLMRGLMRGGGSLVWHSVQGWCNTISKATGSGARALAYLSMDEAFAAEISKAWEERDEPNLIGFLPGLIIGFSSLARLPAIGWQTAWNDPVKVPWALVRISPDSRITATHRFSAAIPGLLDGVLKALAALVAKPFAGLLDVISTMCNQIISAGSFSSSERWKQVRPARSFGSSKALKPLVYQQSHAIQVLMKIDGGKYSMGGAIDVFDLAAGGQLIITPLYLVCVHPRSPKHALWSLPMREILFAEIATPEDEKNLRDFVEEEVYDRNVWVILSCCSSSQAAEEASRRASIISSGSGPINKKTGAFRSYIVQFTSERSAQRLQRVLHDMFELHSSRIAFKI